MSNLTPLLSKSSLIASQRLNTKEKFEKVLGMKITEWEGHTMNGRFQSNKAGTPLVYHCDEQTWAACIYMTPKEPC